MVVGLDSFHEASGIERKWTMENIGHQRQNRMAEVTQPENLTSFLGNGALVKNSNYFIIPKLFAVGQHQLVLYERSRGEPGSRSRRFHITLKSTQGWRAPGRNDGIYLLYSETN